MAKKRLKIDQLAKLRQFTKGMDVEEFLSTQFRQIARAIEQAYVVQDDVDSLISSAMEIPSSEISSSCGLFSTTNTSPTDVTNLSVQIKTTGKRVWAGLVWDDNTLAFGALQASDAASPACFAEFAIHRDSTIIAQYNVGGQASGAATNLVRVPSSCLYAIEHDLPAGTYTYKVKANIAIGKAWVFYSKLKVYEF